jgi:ATP-GRASP peptide maturase of grasp-with-spasm system
MYLIQSNSDDKSTNDIIDWILFLNENRNDLFRLNDTIIVDNFTYQLSNKNGEHFNINNNLETLKIKSFWYRRGRFSYNDSILKTNNLLSQQLMNGIQSNFHRENKHINNCLYHILRKKGNINTFNDNFTNKIANLSAAMEIGLNIPDVLVTNNTADLINFSLIHEKIITKDIEMNAIKASYNENYNIVIEPSVKILRREDILPKNKKTKGTFSLYQQYIEKKYELRIFYLKGKFYPMAIFSQASEKTKIDFRNYDKERPNRCVPYKLPQEIEQKLICVMQSIDMNSGSIDMIYTPEGEYVFLEVNPIGQFQWLSKSCNYDIEREIALDLINETND